MIDSTMPSPHDLIADCGQPGWPGWQWLVALLIAAQIAAVVVTHSETLPLRLRTLRMVEREADTDDTNAVRPDRRAA
jgi:hypothetical protein